MDLTAWQRICQRLLGGVFKRRARNDKKLSKDLVKASMPMMPEVYLATVFVTTIVVSAMGIGMVGLFFCLLYTSPSPRDRQKSRMPSSA